MSTKHCVLRNLSVNGSDVQFVPLSEITSLNPGETIFAGEFASQTEGHGPSGSHKRTVCTPVRPNALVKMVATCCVFRDLGDGTGAQYVRASDFVTVPGERMVIAAFSGQTENHGPSGSHKVVVCSPVSRMFETTVPLAAAA